MAFWSGAAVALSSFADQRNDAGALTQVGFLPELAAYVGPASFGGQCDTPFRRVLQSGGRLGDSLLRSWQRLQRLVRVAEVDGYVGHLAGDAALWHTPRGTCNGSSRARLKSGAAAAAGPS